MDKKEREEAIRHATDRLNEAKVKQDWARHAYTAAASYLTICGERVETARNHLDATRGHVKGR